MSNDPAAFETTDLVARLRELAGPRYPDDICGKALMGQAASEIERLRAVMRVNGLFVGLSRAEMEKILYGR